MNRANAISLRGLGDCTAEALRTLSKEFLIKKYSELGALCAFVVNPTFLIFGCALPRWDLRGENCFYFLVAASPRCASVVKKNSDISPRRPACLAAGRRGENRMVFSA